jgi:hypothetical protein
VRRAIIALTKTGENLIARTTILLAVSAQNLRPNWKGYLKLDHKNR